MRRDRKIETNRANAQASTGPKTARGRARSARNSFRHGLSIPVESNQVLCERAQALTRQIAGSGTSVHIQILACRIADAQVDLLRVRTARHSLLSEELSNPDYLSLTIMRKKLAALIRFIRAFGPDTPLPADMIEFLDPKLVGPFKLAAILSDNARSSKPLIAMSGAPFRDASLQFEHSTQSAAAYRTIALHGEAKRNNDFQKGSNGWPEWVRPVPK